MAILGLLSEFWFTFSQEIWLGTRQCYIDTYIGGDSFRFHLNFSISIFVFGVSSLLAGCPSNGRLLEV